MDKKSSWPWKKKPFDKHVAEKAAASDSSSSVTDLGVAELEKAKQDNVKKPKYVQISVELYAHLTGLEDVVKSYKDQVQNLEDQIKELKGKLLKSDLEMVDKESLVKQHAKVAEEAVSGWEKAEAETAALKNHLESVTLLKLTAEDQASHLDGALKECMGQIRNMKDEHDQHLHEVVHNKNMLFDNIKLQFEDKIANLDQELMRSAAESAALSRSLQERSNMLIQLRDEKSQAEAEIEILKSNIESREREVNSLKYELHIARKEVEIRNEEKNMSVRSADVANKQHLEGVKKIAKLEAECQRLRCLVRKKLPGPAALAQMKVEVENLGREFGESGLRRSHRRPPTSPLSSPSTEFSQGNTQKYLKENELLTDRLLAMEEETKMLKEALARRNRELQDSSSIHAQTSSKLQTLETQLQANGNLKSQMLVQGESFCYKEASNVSSFSTSEDGNDDSASFNGSCSTVLMSEISHFKKEKDIDSPHKSETASQLDLMDDFLEMEKLAYQSYESIGATLDADSTEFMKKETSVEATISTEPQYMEEQGLEPIENADVANLQSQEDSLVLEKLRSKVCTLLEFTANENDREKTVEAIRRGMLDVHDTLDHMMASRAAEGIHSDTVMASAKVAATTDLSLSGGSFTAVQTTNQEIEIAVSQIYSFIMVLQKEAETLLETSSPGEDGLNKNLNVFSIKYSNPSNNNVNLIDFVLDISHLLNKASDLHFNILGFKSSEVDTSSSDCIDKIALPENKAVVNAPSEGQYHKGCTDFSDSADVSNKGDLVPTSETTPASWKCSFEEFEQLKMDKDGLAGDLARCTENFESTKSHLLETEQLLADIKSQLAAAQKSNSLAETQLKCMAESYRSLELRAEELQTEVNLLQGKIESLDTELQGERKGRQDAIDQCKHLQEQLERIESRVATENDEATQEKELAAAAEKLAECQQTIFLLGKQLKALHPQTDSVGNGRTPKPETFAAGELTKGVDKSEMDIITLPHFHRRAGSEANVLDTSGAPLFSLDSEARTPVGSNYHRPTKSVSSTSSNLTPEKHARGFSRFFSPKSKTSH